MEKQIPICAEEFFYPSDLRNPRENGEAREETKGKADVASNRNGKPLYRTLI